MKKIIFLFSLVLVLAGCGQQIQNQPVASQEAENSVFSSIRDAFDRSLALRCEYVDEDGEKSINYIKNKMIRTENADQQGEQVYGLFRDEKLYLWSANSAQGMLFDLSNLQNSDDVTMEGSDINSIDDIISVLESHKDQCQLQNVADSLFDLPDNVTFTDFNALFGQ